MDNKSLLAGVIFLSIMIILLFPRGPRLTPARAFDGLVYMVLEGSAKDKGASANKLAGLRLKLVQLIEDLQHSHELTDDNKRRLKHKFKALISENSPGGRHTSYTVNKGEHIYMCLRSKQSLNFEDDNVVMFVAIHELAHVMTRTIGHKHDFKRNFRMLLKQAEKRGYYTYYPFHIKPKRYCGTVISSLP
jgi:hypothetical protein